MKIIYLNETIELGNSSASTQHFLINGVSDQVQLNIKAYATQTSDLFYIVASDGTTKINSIDNSGNMFLKGGAQIKPTIDSTSALTISNAAGTSLVTFDTTNKRVGIGIVSPTSKLHVVGQSDEIQTKITANATQTNDIVEILASDGTTKKLQFTNSSQLALGGIAAGAILTLPAGTATAGKAPLKFTSGTLLAAAVAGAVEFLTDKWYGTITTGAARKELALVDVALTTGRVVFTTTNGRLLDSANLAWDNVNKYLTITGGSAQSSVTKGLVVNSGLGSGGADSFNAKGSTDQNLIITDTANNRVGFGTSSPTAKYDFNTDILRLRTAKTPATSGAAGNTGDICWDADYIYVCIADSTWRRGSIATW